KKLEITFIISQTLITTISFHPLSLNLVQFRETMAKSKSKKKGNLNSQPSSLQITSKIYILNSLTLFDFQDFSKSLSFYRDDEQIREIWCGEDYATASKSELRSGDDDRTAGRSELRCGDDAVTSRSDFRCGKEDNKLSWCEG
ncbi:unnamed protein product, partial [Brassica rapa subsp. trilocularis]